MEVDLKTRIDYLNRTIRQYNELGYDPSHLISALKELEKTNIVIVDKTNDVLPIKKFI